jgi:hypothetical protein
MSLYQRYLNYLNQGMPDISGIFSNITTTPDDPTNDPVMDPEPGVTPQLLQLTGGGGDDFSVYNPDPTRTRTNYINPFPFNPDDNLGTSDYGYIEPRRDGILGLMDAGVDYLNNSFLGRGLRAARDMLPVNPRAILENELIGKGIMLDDIGRIVTNDYNTPEGIMAGYNAAKMDASTFDDRIANIEKTIARKTAADPNYDPSNLQNRIELIEQAKTNFFDAKDAAGVITDAKKKKKDPTYQTLEEKIVLGLAEGDDDDDDYNFEDYIASINPYGIPTGITSSYPGAVLLNQRNVTRVEDARRALEASRQREAEAAFAAAGGDRQQQAMQAARDQQRIDRAYREDTGPGPGSYGPGGGSGIQRDSGGREVGYNDPFDPGGGE